MIYQLALDLAARMQARKFPVSVFYGPERVSRQGCDSMRVLVSRDTVGGDTVIPARSQHRNPVCTHTRGLGVVALFEVSSAVAGARVNEHEHECDAVVDAFLVELFSWGEESGAGVIPIVETRYVSAEERASGAETLSGAVYLVRFQVPRGVFARDYEGAARVAIDSYEAGCSTRASKRGGTFEVID
jgi:hypothetical protein